MFHPDFQYGKPFYFHVSVCHALQDSLLCLSAATAGVPAESGKANKITIIKLLYRLLGVFLFVPLVVECLGLWSLNSLKNIAFHTTSRSGTSPALAFCYFLEAQQLSICLWRYNSQMLLHHCSLIPGSLFWEEDN